MKYSFTLYKKDIISHTYKFLTMNIKRFTVNDINRAESLCKRFGLHTELDINWRLTTFLTELATPYLRVFNKDNKVIGLIYGPEE